MSAVLIRILYILIKVMDIGITKKLYRWAGLFGWMGRISAVVAKYGYYLYVLYGFFLWWGGNKDRRYKRRMGALQIGLTVGISSLVSWYIGKIHTRKRPFQQFSKEIDNNIAHRETPSFPSNHMMNSWIISSVAKEIGLPCYPCLFLGSILLGLSRVLSGIHYVGDLLGGIVIGEWSRKWVQSFPFVSNIIGKMVTLYEKVEKF